ncbi:MAG: DMT family transporter [Saprospiraceae bacterium]|nr:DMT family transporter [Bacteroidia bacterium]NNE16234.1 DMT family transporter [Saprospiraceae bacterium]NNL91204.1 DMT family transporter [Saprospiraceae bacterium]
MVSRGIGFILIATFAFAFMNVIAKELSNFHPLQVVFFRATGTFLVIFPFMLKNKISILGTHKTMLLLRAVVGSLSLAAFFVVIQRIPLGSAISIRYLGPIFGAIMAYYFLKEKINMKQWISFAIAFAGVIILKGFDLRIDYLSLALVLFSAVSVGAVFVLLRYLGNKEHYLTIINYFMVVSIIFSLFFIGQWRWPINYEWLPVIGIGAFGMIGQIFMTQAFQTEETSVLAPFKYMELVYALIMGYLFFGEKYTFLPFLGIILIILGMLLNVYAKKSNKVLQ